MRRAGTRPLWTIPRRGALIPFLVLLSLGSVAHAKEMTLRLRDQGCAPGKCVCLGSVPEVGPLEESGIRVEDLLRGIECLAADFDGNGQLDFAIPGGEGLAVVIMSGPGGHRAPIPLDASGVLRLYQPRREVGPNGEPASPNPGLWVPWVGQQHLFFVWDGKTFDRILLPSWVLPAEKE